MSLPERRTKTTTNHDLRLLLQLARLGSSNALGELLEGCRQYLLLVANEELDSELAAKSGGSDMVQETFLRAQRHFSQFHGSTESELLAWLRQILRNQLGTLRRKYLLAEKRCVAREVSLNGDRRGAIEQELTAGGDSASRVAVLYEEAQVLYDALSRLPDRYRRVIELRHREQLSFHNVARHLDLSAVAARQLWVRAINGLQRELRGSCCLKA